MYRFAAVGMLLAMIVLAPSCRRETEEDRVRKVISSVQDAVEEKKMRTALEQISPAYRDPQGYDREGIRGLLAFYFLRHQSIHVSLGSPDILVSGPSASASFEALLSARSGGEPAATLLPEALGVYHFDVALQKDNGYWKIASVRWQRTGDLPQGRQ